MTVADCATPNPFAQPQAAARRVLQALSAELQLPAPQIQAAIELMDGGATVPFIARYRKEVTGGMSDDHLRMLEERLIYLRELEDRRAVVLQSIAEQGKLTPELRAAIDAATQKQALEDLYLPYKPRRVTRAQKAREAGLEPLADLLWRQPQTDPLQAAAGFVRPQVSTEAADTSTPQACLDGARDILSERWAEDPAVVAPMREWLWQTGHLLSQVRAGKEQEGAKFRDYFDYAEPLDKVPSHRALAVLRGRAQEVLDARIDLPPAAEGATVPTLTALAEGRLAVLLGWSHQGRAADDWLRRVVQWTWKVKLSLTLERELLSRLREQAEAVAIDVFGANLRDLLLAAPAGPKVVMGLDPGIRTGVKVAVVDATGKLLDTATVYPFEPRRDMQGALATLAALVRRHGVQLIAIGNGTASRETDLLAAELLRSVNRPGLAKLTVSEAGASVYSASSLASREFPDLDVSLRGAVSIARRVQDPLAELVKIDPKSIGVGQYQHDVNQTALSRKLDAIVEDCVNAVGVDLNTASAPLLARVAGLSARIAEQIVLHRDQSGAFANREALKAVRGLGDKTFEQAAGFLRINGGDNPLDRTGVHPESYPLVERLLAAAGRPIEALMGQREALSRLRPEQFVDERFGAFTVRDVLAELEKPGRDPRPEFRTARLLDGVHDIAQLQPGMQMEGTVTNVTAFGAFVDLGVHQDGLVHVSQMAQRFVNDAREVVKTGDIVKVRVVEVDVARKRIALSMRPADPARDAARAQAGQGATRPRVRQEAGRSDGRRAAAAPASQNTAMAAAFAKLKR
ncbi:MAG: Tex family protein [Thiomonas sp.]|uniref:Tex family protein n=1 Tax=Thiomonas sp. TaxID=2047785 RepID=UPI002A35C8A9|nr:Tex family protein [Thiomonas sp.]MDY0328922.1 Tex family protein [Thiomonas sp.]